MFAEPVRKTLCASLLVAVLAAATGRASPIRNVILCIGDGMGVEQVKAARYFAGESLFFETFPHQSLMTTDAADGSVTDSAAAGTAMATGRKVYNGVLSLALPGDGGELETLLEFYKKRGKRTGLVTTTYLTHATPAAFGAHEPSRNNAVQIAGDYLNQTRPNVLFGGGGNGLSDASAVAAGYTVVKDAAQLAALDGGARAYVAGFFGTASLPYEYDGYGTLPHLSQMAAQALDILGRSSDGFFLMVEGGEIDFAGHANDLPRSIAETLEFDRTVRTVVEWAGERNDTLVIVTADHETGGLEVLSDNGAGRYPDVTWTSSGHTRAPVAVYGWGPTARGVLDVASNTDISGLAVSAALEDGVALDVFNADPDVAPLLFQAASGTWRYSAAAGGLYSLSPARGSHVAMRAEVTGPGLLSFDWELIGADGTNALSCVALARVLALKATAREERVAVGLASGQQTVYWRVARGGRANEAGAVIRNVNWRQLDKPANPTPANGEVVPRRAFGGLTWSGAGDTYRVYAGESARALKSVGVYREGAVSARDVAALILLDSGKTVYWRVDPVLFDTAGAELVQTGAVWSFEIIPDGSPEFLSGAVSTNRLTVGVRVGVGRFEVTNGFGGTLSCSVVSGRLPPGVTVACRESGVSLSGVPTSAGRYVATLQLVARSGKVARRGATLKIDATVSSLGRAAGTFNGWVAGSVFGEGPATVEVSASGRIAGRLSVRGTNYIFSARAFDGVTTNGAYTVRGEASVGGKAAFPLQLTVGPDGLAAGAWVNEPFASWALYRNEWKEGGAGGLAGYAGYYTAALCGGGGYGSGRLTLTVSPTGAVKGAGKLADGTGFSQSTTMIADDQGRLLSVLYAAPSTSRGGVLFGLVEFVKDADSLPVLRLRDADPAIWSTRSPTATASYGEGFQRAVGLSGGWFDTVGNVCDYYCNERFVIATEASAREPELLVGTNRLASVWWRPDGLVLTPVTNRTGTLTGFSVPAVGRPALADGVWVYDDSDNVVGLSFRFQRATGLFRGSLKVWFDSASVHTAKRVFIEGVFTPVREFPEDGVEGRGFFLWPDRGQYLDARGRPTTFGFNWSYDVNVLSSAMNP